MTTNTSQDDTLQTLIAAELALGNAEEKYLEAKALMKMIEELRKKLGSAGDRQEQITALIKRALPMLAKLGGAGGIASIATALAADEGAFSGILSKLSGVFG